VTTLFAALGTLLLSPAGASAESDGILDSSSARSDEDSHDAGWTPLSSQRAATRSSLDSDGDGVPGSLDRDPDGDGATGSTGRTAANWKSRSHDLLVLHEKAWIAPTLIHAATPGVLLLAGLIDQAARNPGCFDCGNEVQYAASLAIYFHFGSVIAAGTTWVTFGELHNRIRLAQSRPRLIDRLRQTSRGLGVGAIVAGTIAATSIIAYAITINSDEPWNNPVYELTPLMLAGYIHSGLAAPILAHTALANAAFADQLQAMQDSDRSGQAPGRTQPKPRLLALSPFGLAIAF